MNSDNDVVKVLNNDGIEFEQFDLKDGTVIVPTLAWARNLLDLYGMTLPWWIDSHHQNFQKTPYHTPQSIKTSVRGS